MLENKSEGDGSAMDEPPDSADLDDSEFVEIDPTRRYGRYKEVLGKGAFKTVYRAFDEVDGIEVAWNQVKIQDLLQSPEELERLYSEVHLLKSLKHKNIIKFYHSWVDPKSKNVNFITEIFTSGTLRQYRKKHKHVDIKAVKNWARQILRGLLYLHSHDPPIIHRDLKCDNIFVNGNNGEVKIGDLGLAAILRQAHAAHSVIGTPEFMAPELYEEEYNELVDIYSFGMCLLEMVTFEYPYSECTNAAQIYKKVTSGKRPAALEKIKDPDVRQFIEKCLAVASKRLPARELLTDPFLQSDGNREHLECLPPIPQPVFAGDMDELAVREESGSSHSGVKPGCDSGHSVGSSLFPNGGSRSGSNMNYAPGTPSPSAKDYSLRRSRDFRVKGKMRDESTVFLRLRIADTQGHVRNIHFLFDVEGDTAMSVASEMVEELDLSDQDVTTIADMIDAEILALVPEWNPGASFDDTPDAEDCGDPVEPPPDSSCEKARSELDESDVVGSDEPCLERQASSRKVQSPSFRANALESSPTRAESTMYGRFEEVPYNNVGSDSSPSSSRALLSNSSEHNADEEEPTYNAADPSSPASDYVGKGTWSTVFESMVSQNIHSSSNADNTEPSELACSAFNDLVESQRNAGCIKYTHQTWEEIMNVAASPEGHGGFSEGERDGLKEGGVSTLPWPTYRSAVAPLGSTDEEEELDQELKQLTIKQEQELLDLQKKHERAVLEMKTRWEKRSGSTPSSNLASPDILHCNATCPAVAIKEVADCSGNQAALQCSGSSLICDAGPFSTVITGQAVGKAIESDRLSLKELADMTARVVGFAVKSAGSEQSYSGASEAHVDMIYNQEADDRISVAVDSGLGFQAQAPGLDGQPGSRNRDPEKGAELLCELEEGGLLELGAGCSTEKFASVDRSITAGQQGSLSLATTRSAKCDPFNSRMTEQTDLVVQGRRESYIELYKTCSIERNKLCSSKAETQVSEAVAQELLIKPASSKCDDRALELKKEQLQRSIAELEAKTLEGLHCSKNGFLASHPPKKALSSSSVPSASGGSAASQAKPHSVSESNKV